MKDNASGCFFLNTVYVTQIASRSAARSTIRLVMGKSIQIEFNRSIYTAANRKEKFRFGATATTLCHYAATSRPGSHSIRDQQN